MPVDFAQHRIDEPRRRPLTRQLYQIHAFMDGRMRRHPLQIAQLIDAHPQRNPHLRIQPRRRTPGIALNQEIELRLKAQHAERNFRSQPGIAGIEAGGEREQQVRGISAALHLPENFEGDRTRWRRHYRRSLMISDSRRACSTGVLAWRSCLCLADYHLLHMP